MSKVQRVKDIASRAGEPFGKPRLHKTGVARFLRPLFILAVMVVLSTLSVHAEPLRTVTATVTKISDGDTVQAITPEGTKLKIRLYGIDAPETPKGHKPGEPFGNASRNYLASLVSQRSVKVEILDIDRYRRMVAILWLAEQNVNQEMIVAGMAEAYVEYLKNPYRAPFIQAEQEAKAQGRGVWSQGSRYERPSQFRKRMGG
ncbi:MAG: thermonuclease family protein [Proteobacteria bacterium]|nr:thermonuclease family protein [Pseudomonadota bacterium]